MSSASPPPAAPIDVAVTAADDAPRLYAKTRFVWIYPEADATRQWIGYLRTGSSLRLRSAKPRPGPACPTAFYEVEPWGFVCADGARATLDANDPRYRALAPFAAKTDRPWPYRYAESLGSARYFSLPTPELQRLREGDLRAHWRDVEAARAGQVPAALLGVDVSVPAAAPPELPALPPTVFEDREELGRRSTVAYSTEGRVADRAFVLTADYAWMPKDRIRPYPNIAFHGLALTSGVQLPLAFFRSEKRAKFHRDASGAFSPSAETFERLSHVELTGESVRDGQERYFQTREPGVWLRERDAVLPKHQALTPWGASVGAEDTTGRAPKGRATWIEVSIEGGWLLAFEGTRPVFTTLISPGKGGVAAPGEDPLKRSATPTGSFPISGKFVTSTMEAPGDLIHSDVPFAQNLVGPYALHGAYWHDNWGHRQSGGCINLSPTDAKWMFDFTEPRLPPGWYGMRWRPDKGPATVVILHR
jgi:hypothetical protein